MRTVFEASFWYFSKKIAPCIRINTNMDKLYLFGSVTLGLLPKIRNKKTKNDNKLW